MKSIFKFILLFIPLLLAYSFADDPVVSYLIAWSGSFYIFFLCLKGVVQPFPSDLPFFRQVSRPYILIHLVFAGYMACTSVFAFLSATGYYYFEKNTFFISEPDLLPRLAQAQRYYLMGHIGLAIGLMLNIQRYNSNNPEWTFKETGKSNLILTIILIGQALAVVTKVVAGFGNFAVMFGNLSTIASIYLLAVAIEEKKSSYILLGLVFIIFNFVFALLSGWKEQSLLTLIFLFIYLFPLYKKLTLTFSLLGAALWFAIVPYYNSQIRKASWYGAESSYSAASTALSNFSFTDEVKTENWIFLTTRLSEIGLFVKYIESVPDRLPFYNEQIVVSSIQSLIPRFFWTTKPVTEKEVRKRVISAGAVADYAEVSAKPQFAADAYLSYGGTGVFIFCFILGYLATFFSLYAEKNLGGYAFGTALFFNAFFQDMWRGNCFEFLFNSVFWSFITLSMVVLILKSSGWLRKVAA